MKNKAAIILFFLITAASMINAPEKFSENENRILMQFPTPEIKNIFSGKFEADYEKYLADQFIFRNFWVELKTRIELFFLKREIKGVYVAKDDYFIERHEKIFSTQTAKENISILAEFVKRYEKNFALSVMIIPNAVNILTDKLPPFSPSNGGENFLREVSRALPDKIFFDAYEILKAHSDEEIFYRTDHHWKTLAAFYIYKAWEKFSRPEIQDYEIHTVSKNFQGTIQSKLGIKMRGDEVQIFSDDVSYSIEGGTKKLYDYSALDTKDKYAVFFGGNFPLLKIRTNSKNARKILVIKDSYANCFVPFMLKNFSELHILDLRYSRQRLSRLISSENYTDLLILYNAAGFAEEKTLNRLLL